MQRFDGQLQALLYLRAYSTGVHGLPHVHL